MTCQLSFKHKVSCHKIFLVAGKACHFVDQRDALGLGGDHVIVRGDLLQQSLGAGGGQLGVTEDDEGADHQLVGQGAEGEGAVTARDGHVVVHLFHGACPFVQSEDLFMAFSIT